MPCLLAHLMQNDIRKEQKYSLTLAGRSFVIAFGRDSTAAYFKDWCHPCAAAEPPLSLHCSDWEFWQSCGLPVTEDSEYSLWAGRISEELMPYGCFLFHAAAFCCQGMAYLIAAPSGTGKTTQIRALQKLLPGKIEIICGDRPLVEFSEGGEVMVYPSPWNGKEGLSGGSPAPLAGVIVLRRGNRNEICRLRKKEAIVPLYYSVIHNQTSEEIIRKAVRLEEALLQSVPLWKLISCEVPGSTRLLVTEVLNEECHGKI